MSYFLTPEAIFEMENGFATGNNEKLRTLISHALTYAPLEVVEHAFENCTFICLEKGGAFFPNSLIGARNIIVFPNSIYTWSTDRQIRTILHEAAHNFLGHHSLAEPDFDMYLLDYDDQEAQAWSQVKSWLSRSGYTKPEKERS